MSLLTNTTHQGRSANQAEMVPTATTVKGKEIAINSLRRLNVINEGVEGTTMNTTTKGALMDSSANGCMVGSDMTLRIVPMLQLLRETRF